MQNKIAWITGASSGIGAAIAGEMNAQGATVILSARREEVLVEVQKTLQNPEKSYILPLDLIKIETFKAAVSEIYDKFGAIHYLINNGGISQRANASETNLETDRRIMEVNYFGNIALTKAVLPIMKKQKEGHIVPISSITGKFGFFLRSSYSASKHALQGFYESLRLEEMEDQIKVSIVFPGQIKTEISKHALNNKGEEYGQMDDKQANGMDVDRCARKIVRGIRKGKKEIIVGGKEILIVWIKRYWRWLFYRIVSRGNAT